MTAHQRHIVAAEAFGEVAALLDIGDEQVGVAEIVGDVPDRNLASDKASRMDYRLQRCGIGDPEGQSVLGMRVYYRHHIRPGLEDRRVNEALEIEGGARIAHRLAVEAELDDVLGTDQLR